MNLLQIADGNPGALTVLGQMLANPVFKHIPSRLEQMGLTGSKLWVAYKDACQSDISTLCSCIVGNDAQMLAVVNAAVESGDCGDTTPAKAWTR